MPKTRPLRVRADFYGVQSRFVPEQIAGLFELVARATTMPLARNKAIVGVNAFLHESGICQDGVLKKSSLYEVIPAEIVGRTPGDLFFGRNPGRNALRALRVPRDHAHESAARPDVPPVPRARERRTVRW